MVNSNATIATAALEKKKREGFMWAIKSYGSKLFFPGPGRRWTVDNPAVGLRWNWGIGGVSLFLQVPVRTWRVLTWSITSNEILLQMQIKNIYVWSVTLNAGQVLRPTSDVI